MSSSSAPAIDGYDDLTLIGAGGFSNVYIADQSKLKRRVAIKVLNFGLDDETKRRSFERETELMARVSMHPNIATIHDTAFTGNGEPCIVMGYYAAGSLADVIKGVGRLSVKEAIDVGIAIGSALDASHNAGVVHCDIKPQNILISSYGQPALGDFGISTFADERTQTGDVVSAFTLSYAAPEILEGESPSEATDIYSLAATLYAALAGERPFARTDDEPGKIAVTEQARRILLDELAPLPDVPPELDEFVRTAMSRNPAERPQSATIFASRLYDIGQKLGLAVSVPRTSDHAPLRTPRPDDLTEEPSFDPAAAAAIDPTRLLIKSPLESDETRLSAESAPQPELVQASPPEPVATLAGSGSASRRPKQFALAAVLLMGAALAAFLLLRPGSDSAIVGPPVVEAGTSAVYTVPTANSGSVRWVDWNNEVVIKDSLELTAVLPGVLRFSAIANGETHTREVTVTRSALGPSIEGPGSLGIGETATYTATTPQDSTLSWSTSTGVTGTGSTFVATQVDGGMILQVVATDAGGVERGDQIRLGVDS